ncbi:glycosyltransferase family 4 protein [Methanofollis fontis]|uniref:Glycosyl transferase family 1 domain-containing protein n=1 Tax=Methanofollis fontis TaxID=2052832 RepID=A0A483CY91_9EURY|nr:glycosyltransferase family 4 protein [Methanofollis fontis]TAJ45182.1 hypothetical protein CUJ86_00040 [Methanofollis fontis]
MPEEPSKVCLVMLPRAPKVPYKFLSTMLEICEPITSSVHVITGNTERITYPDTGKVHVHDINRSMEKPEDNCSFLKKLQNGLNVVWIQMLISREILRLPRDVDLVVFYVSWPFYLIPLIASKLSGKRTLEVITRSKLNTSSALNRAYALQDRLLLTLIDFISPESPNLIHELDLERYQEKIVPMGARYIDTNFFRPKKPILERDCIGYIGRLCEEKGLLDFVKAVPLLDEGTNVPRILIGGEGELADEVRNLNGTPGCSILQPGWIPESDLPDYMSQLRVLVLPTRHSEGLPTIILEAMACGTPVLAPAVGGIGDVVSDGKTGFILENTTPECIANNLKSALNHPLLNTISENARNAIEQEYTYERATQRYRQIFEIMRSS